MKLKSGNAYPVTICFKPTPEFQGLYSLKEIRDRYSADGDPVPLLELTTQSIVIVPIGSEEDEYMRNFLEYINQISHHKKVMPQLYDAGYIPYLLYPQVLASSALTPPVLQVIFKNTANRAGVTPKKFTAKYFEDSSTSAAYSSYWITRKEAARIINSKLGPKYDENDTSVTDKITSLDVFDAIVYGR